jgi:HSP20 family protein
MNTNVISPVVRAMSRPLPERFFSDLDQFFAPWVRPVRLPRELAFAERPIRLKIEDNQDHYEVEAELPGARKEDLEISIEHTLVTLSVRREMKPETPQKEEAEGRVLYSDRFVASSFTSRSFNLPEELAAEGHTAKLEEGVLKLNLIKRVPAQSRTLKIAVE